MSDLIGPFPASVMAKNGCVQRSLLGLAGCNSDTSIRRSASRYALFSHLVRGPELLTPMNVVIACGGTGGHLFPGLAVAEVLRDRGHQAMLFISEKEIDSIAVRDHQTRFRFERLPTSAMPRAYSPAMVGFVRGLGRSVARCRQLYREFKPQAVLGMGGFTSTAPLLAGRMLGLPGFVHESNAFPGKANRLNARLARVVLLGFRECAKYFPRTVRCEITGTPIRSSLRSRIEPLEARERFGFERNSSRKTVLVMGGSQGAHGINRAVVEALDDWKNCLQIIHFTGQADEAAVKTAYDKIGLPAYVSAFHHTMQDAYSAADLVVARSGAASLSELAHFGLPSLLIPYPAAADDHQTLNAMIFTQAGAAQAINEGSIGTGGLAQIVLEMIGDPQKLAVMSAAANRLAPPDPALLVVETLEKQCQR